MNITDIIYSARNLVNGRRGKIIFQTFLAMILAFIVPTFILYLFRAPLLSVQDLAGMVTSTIPHMPPITEKNLIFTTAVFVLELILFVYLRRNTVRAMMKDIRGEKRIGWTDCLHGFGITAGRFFCVYTVLIVMCLLAEAFLPFVGRLVAFLIAVIYAMAVYTEIDDSGQKYSFMDILTNARHTLSGSRLDYIFMVIRQTIIPLALFLIGFMGTVIGYGYTASGFFAAHSGGSLAYLFSAILVLSLIWLVYISPQVVYSEILLYDRLIGKEDRSKVVAE